MLVDKGESKRTVNALTRRIALSVALILARHRRDKMGWISRTASAAIRRRRTRRVTRIGSTRRICSPQKQQARNRRLVSLQPGPSLSPYST